MKRWSCPEITYPPITGGLDEFFSISTDDKYLDLLEYSGGRIMVQLIATEKSRSLLLWNPEYMAKFSKTELFCCDGTFSRYPAIAPKLQTKHHQLYVIHAILENSAFPVAWILMNRKTEVSYYSICTVIFKDFKNYSKVIMTDYELASRNALKKCMPLADIRGCFFHLSQAI
ncbi:uncharacterized protein LOC141531664 [Cotesia typhae]|uniref:uncharacterized protein LOC141531664 n=1 Tax=Cotesia typhae TaxID=2053667 RepID=UPI003D68E953